MRIFPHVHPDKGLDLALDRMGSNHVEILPVVNRADVHKLEGIVTLRDVLDSESAKGSTMITILVRELRLLWQKTE